MFIDIVVNLFAGDRHVVDVQNTALHLDMVAGQTDDALDEVNLGMRGLAEDGDIPSLGLIAEDPAREHVRAEGEGISAVAIGVFRHEQVIPDEQRGDHRARGYAEWFEEKASDDERDQNDQGRDW